MKGDKVFNFIIANVQTIDGIKLAARSLQKQTTANMMKLVCLCARVLVWSCVLVCLLEISFIMKTMKHT